MTKFLILFLSYVMIINSANSQEKTVNEVVKASIEDQTSRQSEVKSSEQLANEFLEANGLTKGDNGDIFVAVGTAYLKVKNPKRSNFQLKRRILVSEASLNAKKDFIEFIRTDMSAEDIIVQPETPFSTEFDQLVEDTQNQVLDAMDAYSQALANVDELSAKKIDNIEYDMIAKEGINAVFKKQGIEIDIVAIEAKAGKIKAEHIEALKKAKAALDEGQANIDNIKSELAKIKGKKLKENISVVETLSQMNVVGLFPVANFESWNGEGYSTTIIAVWSTEEEKRARALFAGEKVAFEPTDIKLTDYLNKQDWSSAQGVRKVVDNAGNFWLLSISAAQIKGSSGSQMNRTKGMAQLNAKKQLAFALYSDAKSKEKAMEKMQEIAGKNRDDIETQTAESFSKELSQSIENLQIQGMSEKFGKELIHPISGQKIYVSIVGISNKSVAKAKLMEVSQARATRAMIKENDKSKGIKVGIQKAITETKNDKSSFNKGVEKGYSDVNKPASNKSSVSGSNSKPASGDKKTEGKSKAGSFSGGGVTSGAFK